MCSQKDGFAHPEQRRHAHNSLYLPPPELAPLNYAFELHDSRLQEFERREDGTGFLLFYAVMHRTQGELFREGQESGYQFARIYFTSMHVHGPIVLDEYCLGGSITIEGRRTDHILHLPMDYEGPVRLTLELSPQFETTIVDAQSIRVELEGEFKRECVWNDDGTEDGGQ
jgi:hypothetical protein